MRTIETNIATVVDEAGIQLPSGPDGPSFEEPAAEVLRCRQRIDCLEKQNRVLRQALTVLRRKRYGPSSEKLDAGQLELLDGEPGVHALEGCAVEVM